MVRRCKGDTSCKIIPSFNYINEVSPIFCKTHKKDGMLNVTIKRCQETNCNKFPSYNFLGTKIGIFCAEHKQIDMIDIVNKHCKECLKPANFNLPSETKGIYCAEHKLENMIDVKHPKCKELNCQKIPHFNYENEKRGIYCSTHKKVNMQDVTHKRCKQENCENLNPTFNYESKKVGIYCVKHKMKEMVDVVNKRCKFDGCSTVGTSKYKGYCLRCFINLFPDEKVSKNYKIREQHFVEFLMETYKERVFTFDRTVGGCSKKRPDAYIDLFTHVLVLENDENQHKNYEEECENKRTMEIFEDFANRPIVFIRFNPDSYIGKNGNKRASSFKYHKTLDVPVIRDKKEWEDRLNVLKNVIDRWLIEIPEREVTIECLFYDS